MSLPLLPRSLSIEPVLARLADASCSGGQCRRLGCDRAIAERLGATRRSVQRWKSAGVTVAQADRLAAALATHPAELWGARAWNEALLVDDDARESLGCHPQRCHLRIVDARERVLEELVVAASPLRAVDVAVAAHVPLRSAVNVLRKAVGEGLAACESGRPALYVAVPA